MQSWVKIVEADQLDETKQYFIGRTYGDSCDVIGRGLDGIAKTVSKPGVGIRFSAQRAREQMAELAPPAYGQWVFVEVPADADIRWRVRRRNIRYRGA